MENQRIIDSGDLKERLQKELLKFNFIYKMDINSKNDPFTITAYINPKLCENYNNIIDFLNYIYNKEESANCTILKTNAIKNIKQAYDNEETFRYLLGIEEIKALLWHSYNLPKDKYIDKIIKVHEDIHIFIKHDISHKSVLVH